MNNRIDNLNNSGKGKFCLTSLPAKAVSGKIVGTNINAGSKFKVGIEWNGQTPGFSSRDGVDLAGCMISNWSKSIYKTASIPLLGRRELVSLGEVVEMTLGPQEDNLKVVLGVKADPNIELLLEETIGREAYSVDHKGYLVIPRLANQEKAIAAINQAFGLEVRLLNKEEADHLEEVVGQAEIQARFKQFWTAVKIRYYPSVEDYIPRNYLKPDISGSRLVVGVLARTLKLSRTSNHDPFYRGTPPTAAKGLKMMTGF